MKVLMTASVLLLSVSGCNDLDSFSSLTSDSQKLAGDTDEERANVDALIDSPDVFFETNTTQDIAEQAEISNHGDADISPGPDSSLEEDPTGFESDPIPSSSFFTPEIP